MTSHVDHYYQRQYIPEDPLDESVYRYVALCSQSLDNCSKKSSGSKKLYKSKYAKQVNAEYKNFKTGGKKIKNDPADPNKYLKKGERNKYEKEKHDKNAKYNTHNSSRINIKPPLPKSPGLLLKHETKNYIKNNILTNDNSIPKKVDYHTKTNPNINYLKKKDYGLIPEYIKEMKNSKTKSQQLLEKPHDFSKRTQRSYMNEDMYASPYRQYNRPRMIKLPEEERLKILNGLKKNYDLLSNEYKSISLVLDTCAKVKRKSKLEEQLREIEKSIDKFNQPNIIISS